VGLPSGQLLDAALPQIAQCLLQNRLPLGTPPITSGASGRINGQRPDPIASLSHQPALQREIATVAVKKDNPALGRRVSARL
jgi:hypothetical protein